MKHRTLRLEHPQILMRPARLAVLLTLVLAALILTSLGQWPSAEAIGTPPGSAVSHNKTACADHGGFAALGTFGTYLHDIGINNPGSNDLPGATSWMFPNATTGSTTGGNNNSLCGGGNVPSPFAGT